MNVCTSKKLTAAVVGAMALMGAATSAHAASGNYASVQMAIADVDWFSDGLTLVGTYGIPLAPNFAFEAELTKSLDNPDHRDGWELDYWTIGGYGVASIPLSREFSLRGRLGLIYERVTIEDTWFGGSVSESDTGLSFGFGATYKVSPALSIIGEYTFIESDISHLSAGVRFHF